MLRDEELNLSCFYLQIMLDPQWAAPMTTPMAPCPITHTKEWDPGPTTDTAMEWDPCLTTALMMAPWDPCQTTALMMDQMVAHMKVQMGAQMGADTEALVEVSYCCKHISLHVTECCQQYKIGRG